MFDVGFTELMLVGIIGLIILGPERLPVAARTVGKWVGKAKRTVSGVQREIQEELRLEEIRGKAQANREAIKDRMAELREEAELMEAPVVAADAIKDESADVEASESPNAEPKAEGDGSHGAQPFSEPSSLAAAQVASETSTDMDTTDSSKQS
jgi:sec-independent protein translocase protein TatB